MTNQLEKKFFDTFGMPQLCCKKYIANCMRYGECEECVNYDKDFSTYPQITDHILLELFVIMTRYTDIIEGFDSVQELKEFVLKDLMYSLTQPECNIVKHQVRTLFEDGNE